MKSIKKVIGIVLLSSLVMAVVVGCGKETSDKDVAANTQNNDTEVNGAGTNDTDKSDVASVDETTADNLVPTGHVADTVKIGFVDVTGTGLISDTLGVARDNGFIEEEFSAIGVTAELVPMTGAGPAINEALASKSLDVGFLGDVPAIIGRAAEIDTQLISFNGLNSGASLVVTKDSGFASVQDLKGKKIATQKGAFMHKALIDILEGNGLTINDIEFVNLNAQGAAEAFISGNVDGVVVGGSTLTNLIEGNYGDVLVDYREHPEWKCGGYGVARTKFIDENPDIIKALLRALVKAQQLAIEDDQVLLDQWVSTGNTDSAYEYLYPNHDNYFTIKKTDENLTAGDATIQFLIDNELISNEFDFESWINSSFYEAAYSELGVQE